MINKRKEDLTNNNNNEQNDDKALFWHYLKYHKLVISKSLQIWSAYTLIFLERPSRNNLNVAENSWIELMQAGINKAETYIPKFK